MKILTIVDKFGSAIDRLAQKNKRLNPHFRMRVIDVHPKRPSTEQWQALLEGLEWADIVDFQYWKSALLILQDIEVKQPKILHHHNPYSLKEADWKPLFDVVAVNNRTMQAELPYARLIPLTIDVAKFAFRREDKISKTGKLGMVSSRIEAKKGVLEVAEACKDLGYRLQLLGRISDKDYFDRVMATGIVDFLEMNGRASGRQRR